MRRAKAVLQDNLESRISFGLALVGVAQTAYAQPAPQNLTIAFNTAITSQAVPLSAGLTFAIALILALAALVILRRRAARGGRLFAWLLAVVAGAILAVVTGQRAISEAQALVGPVTLIDLSVSPAILNVAAFAPGTPLTVKVTNTTGQSVQITSIVLASGIYFLSTPTTCVVSEVLPPAGQCTITLDLSPA